MPGRLMGKDCKLVGDMSTLVPIQLGPIIRQSTMRCGEYKLTYYTPEYETKDTDILASFRVTPQPGVPPEEVRAAIAAESSTDGKFKMLGDANEAMSTIPGFNQIQFEGFCRFIHQEHLVNVFVKVKDFPENLWLVKDPCMHYVSLAALSVFGFIACCFVWFNNTTYPREFYGPTGPEASQAQAFTFLVRDQRLGANIGSAQGPTGLEPLRGPNGLDLSRLKKDIQPWQERRSAEYVQSTNVWVE
ncbi:hypothetical protein BUALT_Bualt14G0036100 [Buddleja alternifolia]|uniref:Ribulose bisphosphate carboxylase large chain n=1 Tax=Buddleja alternifolia TaxID=168488 RepID=A0AAV6WRW3_9LAMI|nr:hypothetical protein BUALT_Bualt14G0036100 [Buddleja alternifolia]